MALHSRPTVSSMLKNCTVSPSTAEEMSVLIMGKRESGFVALKEKNYADTSKAMMTYGHLDKSLHTFNMTVALRKGTAAISHQVFNIFHIFTS